MDQFMPLESRDRLLQLKSAAATSSAGANQSTKSVSAPGSPARGGGTNSSSGDVTVSGNTGTSGSSVGNAWLSNSSLIRNAGPLVFRNTATEAEDK